MTLLVKQSITIGSDLVEQVSEFAGVKVYKAVNIEADRLRLYFVRGDMAVHRMDVEAEEGGQGCALIGDAKFTHLAGES